jgi:hypothetical protein
MQTDVLYYIQKERKRYKQMPTNATNYTSQLTYTLTASNGDSPRITYTQEGIPENRIRELYSHAQCSFRDIQVTCDQTGELVFQTYTSGEFFQPLLPLIHTLAALEDINKHAK